MLVARGDKNSRLSDTSQGGWRPPGVSECRGRICWPRCAAGSALRLRRAALPGRRAAFWRCRSGWNGWSRRRGTLGGALGNHAEQDHQVAELDDPLRDGVGLAEGHAHERFELAEHLADLLRPGAGVGWQGAVLAACGGTLHGGGLPFHQIVAVEEIAAAHPLGGEDLVERGEGRLLAGVLDPGELAPAKAGLFAQLLKRLASLLP